MSKIKYSVVVPCYNEEKNIPLILKRFKQAIGKRQNIELILVDNGSRDLSAKVFDKEVRKFPFARLVTIKNNIGYGHGIVSGLKSARGEFMGWTHADMQTDPADVVKAFDLLENDEKPHEAFIKGVRLKRPLADKLFSLVMGWYASLALGKRFYEINAQPTIFSRKLYSTWKKRPNDFSLDLHIYSHAHNKQSRFIRIPVYFPKRQHGVSSWNTSPRKKWNMIKRSLLYIHQLRKAG